MRLHPSVARALEEIDAALFSGDQFQSKEASDVLASYLDRWLRELGEIRKSIRDGDIPG